MKRFVSRLPASIAAAALLSLAAGCASAAGSVPQHTAPTARPGFAGYKWQVVAIKQVGRNTPVPARYDVYLAFTSNGEYGANDPVNFHSGSYRETADGFRTSGVAVSAAGYAGHDPITVLAIQALDSLDAAAATTTLTGDSLQISVGHGQYILVCQRDGTPPRFASAQPSSR